MENNPQYSKEQNELNLYRYSDVDLVNFIKEKNAQNLKNSDAESLKKNEFLIELAIFLEKKLKHNISLHQNGFKIYKQKLLADKTFIQNSIRKDLRSLTINQLIVLLTKIKNESENDTKKVDKYFNIGQNCNSIINQNQIGILNNIFSGAVIRNNENKFEFNNNINNIHSNNEFNNNINLGNNNNVKRINLIHGLNPKDVYHSPSPLIFKKHQSKIIEENENVNNKINFDEEQKLGNN